MNTTEQSTAHVMTAESMNAFVIHAKEQGASENMIRRFSGAVKTLYAFLPEDKTLTKERLQSWRKSMEESGYASITILNYVKYINKYLDYVGASDIRFNRGKGKDISGMTFGFLTALEPTDKRDRKDIVWRCQCKCGNTVELPATRLLVGNTLSCGCLLKEHFRRANMYIDNTSLRQALEEKVESVHSVSGYTGVTRKRDKWKAYITYKGKHYSLGCYTNLEDAVKARARGKELVQADALGLLDFYEEIHKTDLPLPNKATEQRKEFPSTVWQVNDQPGSAAKRVDNKSGKTGVTFSRGRWKAHIGHKGVRYILGYFDAQEDAVKARKQAEQDLKADPEGFENQYQQKYTHHAYGKK